MQFLKERKSEEEEYISAEERQRNEGMKEHSIKSEGMEIPQSLDHTYVTAYESHSLEASEVSSDASLASDVQKQRSLNSEWKGLNMRDYGHTPTFTHWINSPVTCQVSSVC